MKFDILGEIYDIETIAINRSVRDLDCKKHKFLDVGVKGIATIQLKDGTVCEAEIHWYEAHGIGRKEFKIKYIVE